MTHIVPELPRNQSGLADFRLGYLLVEEDGHKAQFIRPDGWTSLQLKLGCAVDSKIIKSEQASSTQLKLIFGDGVELLIVLTNFPQGFQAYRFSWSSTNSYHYMKDIVDTDSGGFWYGGPELAQQRWPLARNSSPFCPYVAGDVLKEGSDAQSGMERYWLCSNKYAICVDDEIPLWTEHMEGRLSLQAQIRDSLYESFFSSSNAPRLSYTIFSAQDALHTSLKEFHMAVHGSLYMKARRFPDERLLAEPIWTTWAKYGNSITQEQVLEFAREIKAHQAPISQLELDDRWSTKYGDFEFDKAKFPNVRQMSEALENLGIRLTLWIHPFLNLDSENARNPNILELMVKLPSGEPAATEWWNGSGYVVDFTNPKATEWFQKQLDNLKKQGIYSFKFDSGEVTYLPRGFRLANGTNPGDFVEAYARMAATFGNAIEVRVFRRTQDLPVMVRSLDRMSTWDNVGLRTLLPIAFNFSIHGYHFNLPDIVGGNEYSEKASKELYIRWIQLNQLLPFIQLSIAPWDFDEETAEVFAEAIKVRQELVGYLLDACRSSCETGEPVICPMWWLSESLDALSCSNQFVIFNRLIVAPVLKQGVTSRSVFLPEGTWQYGLTKQQYRGPIRIIVDAPLMATVPYFTKVE